MLVYLQPAAYCNVSDALAVSEMSKRLWVTIAGPYFEMFHLGAGGPDVAGDQTWRPGFPEALIVAATSGINNRAQSESAAQAERLLLPSDFLEIPNLRRKAFRAIGDRPEHSLDLPMRAPTPVRAGNAGSASPTA